MLSGSAQNSNLHFEQSREAGALDVTRNELLLNIVYKRRLDFTMLIVTFYISLYTEVYDEAFCVMNINLGLSSLISQ